MTGLLDCPSCGARMALEPDTRFCNGCSRIVKPAPVGLAGLLAGEPPLLSSESALRVTDGERPTGAGRALVILLSLLLACCASAPLVVAVNSPTWILPISASDSDPVCVITMDYPGRRCTTAGELRAFVRSIKAN